MTQTAIHETASHKPLDSLEQFCGLSTPTFPVERIGVMPVHRISTGGFHNACAGPCTASQQMPAGLPDAAAIIPFGSAAWPVAHADRRSQRGIAGACPRAGPMDWVTS